MHLWVSLYEKSFDVQSTENNKAVHACCLLLTHVASSCSVSQFPCVRSLPIIRLRFYLCLRLSASSSITRHGGSFTSPHYKPVRSYVEGYGLWVSWESKFEIHPTAGELYVNSFIFYLGPTFYL